ncbi:hypothetical protein ACWGJT_12120 [Streptomyces xantholiticus]
MSDDYRPEGFEDSDEPLPRDMPDQQAGAEAPRAAEEGAEPRGTDGDRGESAEEGAEPRGTDGDRGESAEDREDVPDADEAGAGLAGSPGVSGPGTPAPEETSG